MDAMSIVRTVVLVVALVNQALTITGHTPLPITDQEAANTVSVVLTTVTSLWAWWKNNYLSKKGQVQKEVLQSNNLYKP